MEEEKETVSMEIRNNESLHNDRIEKKREFSAEEINNFLFHVKSGLSQIEKILTGDGYAFSNLHCEDKNIEIIPKEIEQFKYLKYINMSKNNISNIDNLCLLPHILFLDISFNAIDNLKSLKNNKHLQYCMYLNISHNRITTLEDIKLKKLIELDLSHNQITGVNILFPLTIKKLTLSNNMIKTVNTKAPLKNLEFLDLSSNPLENCNFYEVAPNLVFLKLNNISTLTEEHLKSLNKLKALQYLEIQNFMPFQEKLEKEVKQIVLASLPEVHLIKLNKKKL